jgi:hypothetical protein
LPDGFPDEIANDGFWRILLKNFSANTPEPILRNNTAARSAETAYMCVKQHSRDGRFLALPGRGVFNKISEKPTIGSMRFVRRSLV